MEHSKSIISASEREPLLVEKGHRVISSSVKGISGDLPALSPEIYSVLQDTSYEVVLDVGGDKVGARALGRYHEYFDKEPYDMFFVLNANRHQTSTVDGAISYLRSIEDSSMQKVTALVNNTHLCGNTTVEDIMKARSFAKMYPGLDCPSSKVVVEKKFVDVLLKDSAVMYCQKYIYEKPWGLIYINIEAKKQISRRLSNG